MTRQAPDRAPVPDRAWTRTELAHAASLGYGITRTGRPNATAVGAAIGVSARTIQRWLTTSVPTPPHAARLRAALLPDPATLARQRDEEAFALAASRTLATRKRVPTPWRTQGWDQPHLIRVLTHPVLGISRPLIALVGRAKPLPSARGWDVESHLEVPHYFAAVQLRGALLHQMGPWRVRVRADTTEGHTLCWLTQIPHPDLSELLHAIAASDVPPGRRHTNRYQ